MMLVGEIRITRKRICPSAISTKKLQGVALGKTQASALRGRSNSKAR